MATYNSIWQHRWAILQRIAVKRIFKVLGQRNSSLQPLTFFSIKPGYHHATAAEQLDATLSTDEWQKEVYQLAAEIAQKFQFSTILDVGCGSGYKLVNMLAHYDTTGIEINPTFDWLIKKYPSKNWLLFDVVQPTQLKTDLVICADVIEHLSNPDDLLDFISDLNFQRLIISTPERDAVAGKNDYGPPENTAHYREWNAIEFKNYLRQWFVVQEQHIFNTKSVTQVVICQKK
ncbi:MAG: class I SAM-dependent methyltransferase [Chitinophagaceae bacterium]